MTAASERTTGVPARELSGGLVEALFYSVSHDLRSPLVGIGLSAELIGEAVAAQPADAGGELALEGLQRGVQDLERMLAALTALSRAHRRELDTEPAPLRVLLGGYEVTEAAPGATSGVVAVDSRPVRELVELVTGSESGAVRVGLQDGTAVLHLAPAEPLPEIETGPLLALARSLKDYAGTSVEPLAALQLQLERQGGTLRASGQAVTAWLPLAGEGTP